MLRTSFNGLKSLSLKNRGSVTRSLHSSTKLNAESSDDFLAGLLKRMESVQDAPEASKHFNNNVDLSILDKTAHIRPKKRVYAKPQQNQNQQQQQQLQQQQEMSQEGTAAKRVTKRNDADVSGAIDLIELDESNVIHKSIERSGNNNNNNNNNTTRERPQRRSSAPRFNNRDQTGAPRRPRFQNRDGKPSSSSSSKAAAPAKKIRVDISEESFENRRTIKMQSSEFISASAYPLQELNKLSLHRDQARINNATSPYNTAVGYAVRVVSNSNIPIETPGANVKGCLINGKSVNRSEVLGRSLTNGSTVGDYTKPIVLQHTPYDVNFKFNQDEKLINSMVLGKYPTLEKLDESLFVKKFGDKYKEYLGNSESIRMNLQKQYLNQDDLQKKQQLLKVCSGLAPVSSLFK